MAEAIKGLNIKLGLDTTELEASIKSLNSDLKEQQKDLAAINKNLKCCCYVPFAKYCS